MIRIVLVVISAALLWAGHIKPAHAVQFSGDYLLRVCASDKDGKELVKNGHVTCQAYISGVIDYYGFLKSLNTSPPGTEFCLPADEPITTIQRNVYQYILKNKEQQGPFIASPGVAIGLHTYYPCD